MTLSALTFDELVALTGGRLGRHDIACPCCGPQCRSRTNRVRKVLRIWHYEPGFITFCCARCGIKGHVFADERTALSRDDCARLARARAEQKAFEQNKAAERLALARHLWRCRRPIVGTVADPYLRKARGFFGAFPATFGFLPPRGEHPPSLIGAFGLASEPEPGVLEIAETNIVGVHLTRLLPDGSGKDERDGPAKIMIGRSLGFPIVLAPVNDGGGLGITEGIENGLSVLATRGLGVWVAGSASRLPALAGRVPDHVDCTTIFADGDAEGMRRAHELERRLHARGLFAAIAKPPEETK